jgi:hypothetical protein
VSSQRKWLLSVVRSNTEDEEAEKSKNNQKYKSSGTKLAETATDTLTL